MTRPGPADVRHCARARAALWPLPGPRAWRPEVEAAARHLRQCAACLRFFEREDAFVALLRERAPRAPAPTAMRERLFGVVARERARRSEAALAGGAVGGAPPPVEGRPAGRGPAPVVAALVAVGTLALASVPWGGAPEGADPAGLFAEDHARALAREGIESSSPAEVERWLGVRVPFAVAVHPLPGTRLRGGRLCLLDGRTGAVVEYEAQGRPLSYYVMPGRDGSSAEAEAARFREDVSAGYSVVAWREGGLTHALVGDLPRGRLRRMAEGCAGSPGDATDRTAACGRSPHEDAS